MASLSGTESVEELAVEKLQNFVKEVGGEVKTLADLSSPEKFLNWQFPDWKSNNETVMIPPAFTPSQMGLTVSRDGKYLHDDTVNITGVLGEELVYECLRQNGKANRLGMFVIHGFKLEDIINWNKRCSKERKEDEVPQGSLASTGEQDFIIFHHKKGVILIEVKNLKEADKDQSIPSTGKGTNKEKVSSHIDKEVTFARDVELERSRQVIRAFTKMSADNEQMSNLAPLPITMVIALPSTKKSTEHARPGDTLFIYEEDFSSPDSFSEWWKQNIEEAPSMVATAETAMAYEIALSRMLAVRHLGPVSESEYIAYTSYTLETFKHLDKLAGHFRTIKEIEYPHLFRWCREMFQTVEHSSDLPTRKERNDELLSTLKSLHIAKDASLLKNLNKRLHGKRFLCGDEQAAEDAKLFQCLSQLYIIDRDSIVHYMNRVTAEACKTPIMVAANRTLTELSLDNTDKIISLNQLSRFLVRNKSQFLEGECCTKLDVELCSNLAKGDIRVHPLPWNRPCAPIFTVEQLAVFEGPKKQLIIGGPGSGKTELMRSKALMLSQQSKGKQRILYLIQLPEKEKTVFPNTMERYFKENKAKGVDVMATELEGENKEVFKQQCSEIKQQLQEYSHVFIDELWIGSKIIFQIEKDSDFVTVVDELGIVKYAIENIEGYVWMSSVFDYKEHSFEPDEVKSEEEILPLLLKQSLQGKERPCYKVLGTPLLLETLRKSDGVVRRLKHLLRNTNSIVKLLQDYSLCYWDRDFPYGTDHMLNHNVEGQEIDWVVVQPQSSMNISAPEVEPTAHQPQAHLKELIKLMYKECGDIIQQVLHHSTGTQQTHSTSDLRPPSMMKTRKSGKKFQLLSGDILVVNFVVRYQSTNNNLSDDLKQTKIPNLSDDLKQREIPIHDLKEEGAVSGDFPEEYQKQKVCVLNSSSRYDSTLIEGTEWPMVIVLLTSELLFNAKEMPFEMLRNYDSYIAMFRAQAKLVVISDSWKSSQDFLKVVQMKNP